MSLASEDIKLKHDYDHKGVCKTCGLSKVAVQHFSKRYEYQFHHVGHIKPADTSWLVCRRIHGGGQ